MSRVAALALLVLSFASPGVFADEPPPARQQDVIYGRKFGTALTLDVFRPAKEANGLGLIFVVSGGWFSSHDNINQSFVRPFTDRGYTVFAVVHGSQPKFTIPEVVSDMNRSIRFIRHHAKDYQIDPERLGIFGASAGGHLSLMQGTAGDKGNPTAADPVDREPSRVAAVACFFPPTDFLNYGKPREDAIGRGTLKDFGAPFDFHEFDAKRKRFVEVTDEAKIVELGKSISPINHVSADDPPTLIIHGDADKLVPIQQAEIIVEKLKGAGVEAKLVVKPGAAHGWPNMDKDVATLADWFDAHLKKPVETKADAAAPIRSDQARNHVGERATVETTIQASKDAEKRKEIYLDSEADFGDPKNFAVVISYDALGEFKAAAIEDLASFYKGKKLLVTGTIVQEGEQIRIRVEEPGQIKVVE
jgi:acetyl esterase/lipase